MNRADRQFLKLVSMVERARRNRKPPRVPTLTVELMEARAASPEPMEFPAGIALPEVPKPPRRRKLAAVA
jgi:hypothetical protein